MGLFDKKATRTDIDELRAALGEMQERLERSEALTARHERAIRDASPDEMQAQLALIAERMTASDREARVTAERLVAAEQRLTEVGTQLANQLRELGSDIDALADSSDGRPVVSDEVLDHLRSSQTRLAAEQARYQIAFREDLAVLAEQVRRLIGR